ncbi:MAG: hypothetical protein HYW48_06775 [Deltaproteobacteria bacterium]|nr:hypothetical protein [Deltaproteobacteria bacterium]
MEERRQFDRLELESLSARLILVKEDREVDYFPINVSRRGINVFTSSPLPVDEKLLLELDTGAVELTVRWCKAKPDDPAFYRCGLEVVNDEHLDELVQDHLRAA